MVNNMSNIRLPEIEIIAGDTKTFDWGLVDEQNNPYDLVTLNATIKVAFARLDDKSSKPFSDKTATVYSTNRFTITLNSDDTIDLNDRYVYQIIVTINSIDYRVVEGVIKIREAIR